MLGILRAKTKMIIIGIIVLIIPAFVLWGVNDAVTRRLANFAGKINNERISIDTYNRAYSACTIREKMIYGENFNKILKYLFLEQKAWKRILLLKEAKKQGLIVTNEELSQVIESYPFFHHEGTFSKEKYYYILARAFSLTPSQYEKQERENILIQKLTESVINGIVVSEQDIYDSYKLENNKIKIMYSLVNLNNFYNNIKIEDEKVKQYYEENKSNFKKSEQRKIEYIKIPFSNFKSEITENQIKEYYDSNKKSFEINNKETKEEKSYQPLEQVKDSIKTILIENSQKEQAYSQADKIIEKLLDGSDIAKVCKNFNILLEETDFFYETAESLKNIPFSSNIIKQAFTLEKSGLSDIIEGKDGYYIIKLKEIKPADIPLFEEVKDKVLLEANKELSQKLAKTAASNFREKIFELMKSGKSFKEASEAIGLTGIETKPFTANSYIENIGYSPLVSNEAFKLKENELSQVIQVEDGYLFFIPMEKINISFEEYTQSKDLEKFKDFIIRQKKELVYTTWLNQLMSKTKIELNKNFFDENLEKQIQTV